jgi:arylsulfatase A-like enzyme
VTNVLLVVMDTTRADALEPYGASAGASPAVRDLALRGAAHDAVYATACWTLPSHVSMLTGALPREVGLSQAPGGTPLGAQPVVRSLADRSLPRALARAGWDTRAVSANVWVSKASGFDAFFGTFAGAPSERYRTFDRGGLRGRVKAGLAAARGRIDDGAQAAERTIRGWLDEPSDKPFFWFVNLLECHSPYLPPRPYGDVGTIGRLRAAAEGKRHLNLEAIARTCLGAAHVPDGALERMRALYAGAVRYVDDWLAGVLEAMDAKGLLEDTLVIVTSDHGENFGENGLLGHALSLDDRLTRVPFIAAGPGAPERIASLAELPGLVADAVGLEDHQWRERELPPAAVAQFDPLGDASDPELRSVMDAWDLDDTARARMVTPLMTATDGRLKLQRRGGIEEVFDLRADPLELSPQPAFGEGLETLRSALDHPLAAAVSVASPSAAAQASPDELADLESRMRLLGYL